MSQGKGIPIKMDPSAVPKMEDTEEANPSAETKTAASSQTINTATLTTVGQSMYYLLSNGSFTDVSFLVGPTREEFKCHKLVLASASEVFNVMVQDRWRDASPNDDEDNKKMSKNHHQIILPNSTPEAFKHFLTFLYLEEFPSDVSFADAIELLSLAHQYNIPKLIWKCTQLLLPLINVNNCIEIYQATRLYPELGLSKKALEFLYKDFETIAKSSQFLTIDEELLTYLLKSDHVKIDEISFFKALIRWGQENMNGIGSEEPGYKSSAMNALFSLIRYPLMDAETFALEVVPTKALSSEAALEMLAYLNGGISKIDMELLPAITVPRGNGKTIRVKDLDYGLTSVELFSNTVIGKKGGLWNEARYLSLVAPSVDVQFQLKLIPQVRFKADQAVTIYGVEMYGIYDLSTKSEQSQPDGALVTLKPDKPILPYLQTGYCAITTAESAKYSIDVNTYAQSASKGTWFVMNVRQVELNKSFKLLLKEPIEVRPGQWYWISAAMELLKSRCINHNEDHRYGYGWTDYSNSLDFVKVSGRVRINLKYVNIGGKQDVYRTESGAPLGAVAGCTGIVRSILIK